MCCMALFELLQYFTKSGHPHRNIDKIWVPPSADECEIWAPSSKASTPRISTPTQLTLHKRNLHHIHVFNYLGHMVDLHISHGCNPSHTPIEIWTQVASMRDSRHTNWAIPLQVLMHNKWVGLAVVRNSLIWWLWGCHFIEKLILLFILVYRALTLQVQVIIGTAAYSLHSCRQS